MIRRARVLVVDDSVVVRRFVTEMLGSDPRLEVVGSASNGKVALERVTQLAPDLVVLDVEMPEMGGFETLARLQALAPRLPIIMFSAYTERGGTLTLEALARGASDYVTKPSASGGAARSTDAVRDELVAKAVALTAAIVRSIPDARHAPAAPAAPASEPRADAAPESSRTSTSELAPGADDSGATVDVVIIAASTGGPNAISELFRALPASLPVPVLIAQHMPAMFTRLFAERLTRESGWLVREAEQDAEIRAGHGWVAPGDHHLEVRRDGTVTRLHLHQGPQEHSCRPAADVLFRSCAAVYGPGVLAVVLTGMGHDGTRGAAAVRAAGGRVFVQDAETSVVPSMPNSVRQAGYAHEELPLGELGPAIVRAIGRGRSGPRSPAPSETRGGR